jgi:hypothetical protein
MDKPIIAQAYIKGDNINRCIEGPVGDIDRAIADYVAMGEVLTERITNG